MQATLVISVVVFLALGFTVIGGPMILTDKLRRRRQMAVEWQIALTDALDARLGPIVAPLVRKPLFAPWEVRIGIPFPAVPAIDRIVAIVNEVLSDHEGMRETNYRVVLTPNRGPHREAREPREHRPAKRWASNAAAG